MNKTKADKIIFVLESLIGALLALGVKFLFHGCRSMEGEASRCAQAENAVFILGLVMCAAAVAACLIRNRKVCAWLSLLFTVLAILVIVLPGTVLPLCMLPDMRCLTLMRPVSLVIGIAAAVVGAAGFIYGIRKEGK